MERENTSLTFLFLLCRKEMDVIFSNGLPIVAMEDKMYYD